MSILVGFDGANYVGRQVSTKLTIRLVNWKEPTILFFCGDIDCNL
jgi:hypothetical protein